MKTSKFSETHGMSLDSNLMTGLGLEPRTSGLKGRCSTN